MPHQVFFSFLCHAAVLPEGSVFGKDCQPVKDAAVRGVKPDDGKIFQIGLIRVNVPVPVVRAGPLSGKIPVLRGVETMAIVV